MYNFTNRLALATGQLPNPEYHALGSLSPITQAHRSNGPTWAQMRASAISHPRSSGNAVHGCSIH